MRHQYEETLSPIHSCEIPLLDPFGNISSDPYTYALMAEAKRLGPAYVAALDEQVRRQRSFYGASDSQTASGR